jgi:uncharacterized protein with FMN-binding domain
MKRALLIATGTVGGLGAVLAVTPPTLTSAEQSLMALPGTDSAPATTETTAPTPEATASKKSTASAAAPAPTASSAAKSSSANQKSVAVTQSQSSTAAETTPTPTPTPTKAATKKMVSGTFTGDSVDVRYGYVQVKITVENGKITDAQAVQAPSGRNDRWTQMSVPVLRERTLAAQSANISGVSGASFTSYGWYTSLVSALAKAGM